MDRGRVFVGQVLDADGKPRAGVLMECEAYRHVMGHTVTSLGPTLKMETDSEGRFRTPPLPIASLSIVALSPDYRTAWANPVAKRPAGEETLAPIRLEKDVPIYGIAKDENGKPVVGAKFFIGGNWEMITDAAGKFIVRGFGPEPGFQLLGSKDGHEPINRGVRVKKDGIYWHNVYGDRKQHGPTKELLVVMKSMPNFWIEGHAVDAISNKPVRLDKVILCELERKPDGQVERRGCSSLGFEQPETGRFRIPYVSPGEYHASLFAAGYVEAEVVTPDIKVLKNITGLIVKMKKEADGAKTVLPKQQLHGVVTRDGQPVKVGWVGLWFMRRDDDAVNAPILRGRTVESDPFIRGRALIVDGKYRLEVPFDDTDWYIVVEAPGEPMTQIGPLRVKSREEKKLDIACVQGGAIAGKVKNVPKGWEDDLWAIAFTKTGIRAEARVKSDGTYRLDRLPPGEYGVKVGHDGFLDAEVPRGDARTAASFKMPATPWKNARVVAVTAGRESDGVVLELPPPQDPPSR